MFRLSLEFRVHENYLSIAFYSLLKFTIHTEFNSDTIYQIGEVPCDILHYRLFSFLSLQEKQLMCSKM